LSCSLEWLLELDHGLKRADARKHLQQAQAVCAAFTDDWNEAQQQLADFSNGKHQ